MNSSTRYGGNWAVVDVGENPNRVLECHNTAEQAEHARDVLNAHEKANGRPEVYQVRLRAC